MLHSRTENNSSDFDIELFSKYKDSIMLIIIEFVYIIESCNGS